MVYWLINLLKAACLMLITLNILLFFSIKIDCNISDFIKSEIIMVTPESGTTATL